MIQPIFTGTWGKCHIQGIAVDEKKGFIYYSFTTKLIKARLDGTIVGSVDGLLGHLGCIDFCPADGKVYGSLEFKLDAIGRGIFSALGIKKDIEDAFYMAIFDVDRIDRMDMDAEKDGIMRCVYLKEVVDDYKGSDIGADGQTLPHRYGCSGIDGTAFGPMPGADANSKPYLFVTYGIYGDTSRGDNDHQVILCYDTDGWDTLAKPLRQDAMHHIGPAAPTQKLFLYTGNTVYGVQNLEYDPVRRVYWMAVYAGQKPEYPNYSLFAVDAAVAPRRGTLRGRDEEGLLLTLKPMGAHHAATDTWGWYFPFGSTGLYISPDGTAWISEEHTAESGQCSFIQRYAFDEKHPFVLKD